jgi:hypothetical protein
MDHSEAEHFSLKQFLATVGTAAPAVRRSEAPHGFDYVIEIVCVEAYQANFCGSCAGSGILKSCKQPASWLSPGQPGRLSLHGHCHLLGLGSRIRTFLTLRPTRRIIKRSKGKSTRRSCGPKVLSSIFTAPALTLAAPSVFEAANPT